MRPVFAPIAASRGNGEPSWRAKWWTRKYAPSAPSASAATARSIDWSRASEADLVPERSEGVQCPKERKPIFFTGTPRSTTRSGHRRAIAGVLFAFEFFHVDSETLCILHCEVLH